MDSVSITCSTCHIAVRESDYYCFNCGKNLKPKPLSTSISTQLMYYSLSLVLPPMGFIWGIRYFKEPSTKAKMVGSICMILTILVIVIAVQTTIRLIDTVNSQVNSQMQNILQF